MELIRRSSRLVVLCLCQLSRCYNAVSNLQVRNLNHFLTYTCLEAQIQLRFTHLRNIVERATLRVFTTLFVINELTVLFGFLSYIGYRLANGLLTRILQYRSNYEYTLLSEFLCRESTGDLSVNLVTYLYQRVRINGDLIGFRQRFVTGCQQCYCSNEAKK